MTAKESMPLFILKRFPGTIGLTVYLAIIAIFMPEVSALNAITGMVIGALLCETIGPRSIASNRDRIITSHSVVKELLDEQNRWLNSIEGSINPDSPADRVNKLLEKLGARKKEKL